MGPLSEWKSESEWVVFTFAAFNGLKEVCVLL